MRLGFDIKQEQKQTMAMTTELVQAIKLLQLNSLELSAYMQEQLRENPVLETSFSDSQPQETFHERDDWNDNRSSSETDWTEQIERLIDAGKGDISYRQKESRSTDEGYSYENFVAGAETLKEHLKMQLHMAPLAGEDGKMADYIIECIDDNGYLNIEISEIAKHFGISPQHAEEVLKVIQTFEPSGVGARNLKECLLIQLENAGTCSPELRQLISCHMEDLAANKISRIAKEMDIPVKRLQELCDIIRSLEPKPGRQYAGSDTLRYIIPDISIEKVGDQYVATLNSGSLPQLRVSTFYQNMLRRAKNDKELSDYLKEKVDSAMWLIRSIEQRNSTILKVAGAIVNHQKEFFDKGEDFLKPLTLKQIAEEVGVHESTVSRAVNGKYLQAGSGVYELKYFFNSAISSSGEGSSESVASLAVRKKIKDIIAGENPASPLSDQTIAEMLGKSGIDISRRTIAKYRDEMQIPSSSKRKRY